MWFAPAERRHVWRQSRAGNALDWGSGNGHSAGKIMAMNDLPWAMFGRPGRPACCSRPHRMPTYGAGRGEALAWPTAGHQQLNRMPDKASTGDFA
jgi:hypothetical protein